MKTACVSGYHAASVWEIADPSNLKYNTALGFTSQDSGSGPTTDVYGWVRTGYFTISSTTNSTPGQANCYGWTTASIQYKGTVAGLPNNWTAGTEDLGVWHLISDTCDSQYPVWCIEN